MYAWESIQQTINYFEEQYDEEIDIEALAKIANLSIYYYQSLFYRLVKRIMQSM